MTLYVLIACSVGFTDCHFAGMVPKPQCMAAINLASATAPFICLAPDGEHLRSPSFAEAR